LSFVNVAPRLGYEFSALGEALDAFRKKLRIAVIYAGNSAEPGAVIYQTHNPRSWKSYRTVAEEIQTALLECGFEQVVLMPDDMSLPETLRKERIHLAWLNTAGVQGYDSMCHTPAMLEMLGLPYVGHSPLNSSTLDNKRIFKRELLALGIRTAPFITWDGSRGPFKPSQEGRFAPVFEGYGGPFVVKPVSGRASLNVHVVKTPRDLPEVVQRVYEKTKNHVLIEKYLPGREFCVSVAGPVTSIGGKLQKATRPFAFSPLERIFERGEAIFTSMDPRPITLERARLLRDDADRATRQILTDLGGRIYADFNLRSVARIDLREDDAGALHILEANPKPDLKKPTSSVSSLVTMGLEENGMTYNDLVLSLLADRIDHLLSHRLELIPHITRLL
jgi:D-alanine-D-alanine ligase